MSKTKYLMMIANIFASSSHVDAGKKFELIGWKFPEMKFDVILEKGCELGT